MKLSKNSFYKSWAPKLIFSNEIFFRKIRIIFDIEKWLWKSEFCNLAGLITSTKNVQKFFRSHFCDQWSISFSLKIFYQIPLTWSKYYPRLYMFRCPCCLQLLCHQQANFPSISYYFHIPKIFLNFFPHTGKNRNRRKSNLLP